MALTFTLDRAAVLAMLDAFEPGSPVRFALTTSESESHLLGTTIPLGPATFRVTAALEQSIAQLRRDALRLTGEEELPVRFVNAEVLEEFSDWPREVGGNDRDRAS